MRHQPRASNPGICQYQPKRQTCTAQGSPSFAPGPEDQGNGPTPRPASVLPPPPAPGSALSPPQAPGSVAEASSASAARWHPASRTPNNTNSSMQPWDSEQRSNEPVLSRNHLAGNDAHDSKPQDQRKSATHRLTMSRHDSPLPIGASRLAKRHGKSAVVQLSLSHGLAVSASWQRQGRGSGRRCSDSLLRRLLRGQSATIRQDLQNCPAPWPHPAASPEMTGQKGLSLKTRRACFQTFVST